NDLAFAGNPAFPKNPHTFLTNIAGAPAVAAVAVGAQTQIGVFFASGGALTIGPDCPGPLFEVALASPLPADLGFIAEGILGPGTSERYTRYSNHPIALSKDSPKRLLARKRGYCAHSAITVAGGYGGGHGNRSRRSAQASRPAEVGVVLIV